MNNILNGKYNKIFAHHMNTYQEGMIYTMKKIDLVNMFLEGTFRSIYYHFLMKKSLKGKDNIENYLNRNNILVCILYILKNY